VKPAEWIEMMLYLITPGGGRTATKEARAKETWKKHGRELRRGCADSDEAWARAEERVCGEAREKPWRREIGVAKEKTSTREAVPRGVGGSGGAGGCEAEGGP
jgi:hypothetical protein